jgi:hypothetical protein
MSKKRSQAPPNIGRSRGEKTITPSTITPRPYALQPTPMDYNGEPPPKMPQKDIMSLAKREGEVLKAHGVTQNATRQELLTAKRTVETQTNPTPPPVTPAPAQKAPQAPAPKYSFSDKAKAAFAKLNPKKIEPQKEKEKQKEPEKEQQPKKRGNER